MQGDSSVRHMVYKLQVVASTSVLTLLQHTGDHKLTATHMHYFLCSLPGHNSWESNFGKEKFTLAHS